MNKKNFLIIGVLFGLVVAYFVWSNFFSTGPSTSRLSTDFELSATELYEAFDRDEAKANEMYLNKILEVEGTVTDVVNSDDLKPSISLQTNGFGVIKCSFESAEALGESEIQVGVTIKLKGECIGYLLDVLLTNTIIIND